MVCELKDCKHRRGWKGSGCISCWPMHGNRFGLSMDVITVARRCMYYEPRGWESDEPWYWPVPEGSAFHEGSPEAVKMWLDAGLPEDFRLPGQEGV